MSKINLPNDGFGVTLMLLLIILVAIVPFLTVFWLVSLVAPFWVAAPFGLLVSLLVFLRTVRYKN